MSVAIPKKNYGTDVALLLKLGIPMVLTGVAAASTGFFSTLFLARLGHEALAAGAIAIWLFATLLVIVWGTLSSTSVLVAQFFGAKDDNGIADVLRDSLVLAVLSVLPTSLLLWNIAPILLWLGQSHTTVILTQAYLHGIIWGLFPDFVTLVLMNFLIGLGHARTEMVFVVLGVPLNIICNYILMFGKFGMPPLGIAGIGWGTTLAFWIWGVIVSIYLLLHPTYRHYILDALRWKAPKHLWELIKIGVPMGGMYCIEVGFFFTITLMMGHFGSQYLAANQIALQFLGQLSVVTFAMAQAVTVRVGHCVGAKTINLAQRASYAGIFIAVLFMFLVALCYWFIPQRLIAIDLNVHAPENLTIVHYAEQFLAICAVFELLEAIRFILFGALRGLRDTTFTLFTSIISFWGIALPVGYLLATRLQWYGVGLWWGMVFGAAFSSVLLYFRFESQLRKYYD